MDKKWSLFDEMEDPSWKEINKDMEEFLSGKYKRLFDCTNCGKVEVILEILNKKDRKSGFEAQIVCPSCGETYRCKKGSDSWVKYKKVVV